MATVTGGPGAPPQAPAQTPEPSLSRHQKLLAAALTVVLLAGISVAVFAATGGLSAAGPSSVIPVPPPANAMFTRDEDGTGSDNQENILAVTAPGMVHLVAAGGHQGVSAASRFRGLGVVLTPSGIVLTAAQGLPAAGSLTVQEVLSGRDYPARIIGTDRAAGLALLQIEGGGTFETMAIGNSRDFAVGAAVTAVGSNGIPKSVTLDLGNLSGRGGTATVAGRRLTGLLQASAQVLPGQETGGPLVNLSGQAIGIDVAGTGSGLHSTGLAVPINQALEIARQIAARHA